MGMELLIRKEIVLNNKKVKALVPNPMINRKRVLEDLLRRIERIAKKQGATG